MWSLPIRFHNLNFIKGFFLGGGQCSQPHAVMYMILPSNVCVCVCVYLCVSETENDME